MPSEDPLLQSLAGSSGGAEDPGNSFFQQGLDTVKLTKEQVDFVGKHFLKIFEQLKSSRNGLVMAHSAIYAIGTRGNGNQEWREHAAHSLRELLHHWKTNTGRLSNELSRICVSETGVHPDMKTHADDFARMIKYYQYFSCICHHEANDIIIAGRGLDGDGRKSGHDSETDFLNKVQDFFTFFSNFFNAYSSIS